MLEFLRCPHVGVGGRWLDFLCLPLLHLVRVVLVACLPLCTSVCGGGRAIIYSCLSVLSWSAALHSHFVIKDVSSFSSLFHQSEFLVSGVTAGNG